jgi:predicted phosphoadenosine phosphosulfate sulfurtransferase
MGKHYLDIDCYSAARERVRIILEHFPRFYVSFSGGKDSGALLNLVVDVAREMGRLPVTALILDLEGQYQHTIDYLARECDRPEVKALWVCLPLHLRNAVSQFQPHWLCWDPRCPEKWIRPLPRRADVISDEGHFPFFRSGMEFEEFVPAFGDWFADGVETACFVGIRSDESLNRYRTITSETKQPWQGHPWTTRVTRDTGSVYNAYPLYDWGTADVWIANARQHWDYNRVYDLMHLAGLGIHQMRLCQPYGDDQRKGLWLFKILEPETWSRVVERVQGANFGNRYVQLTGSVMGNIRIDLPEGHTWRSYAYLILTSMPPPVATHYRKKIAVFLRWWRKHGKDLGYPRVTDEAAAALEAKRKAPSWRRICKTLLKNDYWCKGLSFTQTKREMERQLDLVTRYMEDL